MDRSKHQRGRESTPVARTLPHFSRLHALAPHKNKYPGSPAQSKGLTTQNSTQITHQKPTETQENLRNPAQNPAQPGNPRSNGLNLGLPITMAGVKLYFPTTSTWKLSGRIGGRAFFPDEDCGAGPYSAASR